MPPGNSLRGRLIWVLASTVVVMALLQAFIAYRNTNGEANEIFDYHMRQMAMSLQGGLSSVQPKRSPGHAHGDEDYDFVIQVWSPDGKTIFDSSPRTSLPFAAKPGFTIENVQGVHYRVFTARTPTQIIRVGQELEARQELAATMTIQMVAPILLLAPVMLAAVWMAVRRSTQPILEARDLVAHRAAEDLSPLPADELPDEVKPLVDEINLLFIRLKQAFEAQRNFVSDAAHELRTPLTALRLQTQAIQRSIDDEARALAVQRLLGGVDRAAHLVEQLLVLARQEDSSIALVARAPVDLASLSGLAIGDVLPLARAKGIDLGLDAPEGVLVPGREEPLRILVRNLLENAIKFSPEGGIVDVAVRREENRAVLLVSDSGPGVAPEELERVFGRFYRVPGQAEPGSGLGLAIVRAIAKHHQGIVTLGKSTTLGGLACRVDFPLHPTSR